MFERDYNEKRDFHRMYVEATVKFIKDGDSECHEGTSVDLSGNGVGFVTDQALSVGDVLYVTITSELARVPPLELEMEVVRVLPESGNRYLIGALRRQPV
jgi:hypothetical protein